MYLWVSHKILVAKSCGGGFRKWKIGCAWFWLYLSHSHCNLVTGMVKMYAPVW